MIKIKLRDNDSNEVRVLEYVRMPKLIKLFEENKNCEMVIYRDDVPVHYAKLWYFERYILHKIFEDVTMRYVGDSYCIERNDVYSKIIKMINSEKTGFVFSQHNGTHSLMACLNIDKKVKGWIPNL